MKRPPPALGRRARVEDPGLLVALDLRQVRVAVEHRLAAGKAPEEALLPPRRRPGDVHDPEPRATDLDDELLRQQLPQGRLVRIAVDGVHRGADRPQLVQHGSGGEVAAVDDRVCTAKLLQTCLGEPAGSPRKMCVGDRRDEHGARRYFFFAGFALAERSWMPKPYRALGSALSVATATRKYVPPGVFADFFSASFTFGLVLRPALIVEANVATFVTLPRAVERLRDRAFADQKRLSRSPLVHVPAHE